MMKGQTMQLAGVALTIVLLIVIVAIGAQVISTVQTNQLTTGTNSVTNESFRANTSATYTVTNVGNSVTVLRVEANNVTHNLTFVNQIDYNYTSAGVITWYNSTNNNSYTNVTYNWNGNILNEAYNISGKGLTGLQTYGDWFTIIVIVAVAAFVIALLLGTFGRQISS